MTRLQFIVIITICFSLFGEDCGVASGFTKQEQDPVAGARNVTKTNVVDNLEWLVGKWQCVKKQWRLGGKARSLGSHSEGLLEYFNVYLPYADEQLTCQLTDNPDDRPIAAEFLVKKTENLRISRPELVPMYPSGLVRISRDRIWVGAAFDLFEFKYWLAKGTPPRLVLKSKHWHLELEKTSANAGDLKESFVDAAVRKYSSEKLEDLQQKFLNLKTP